MSLVAVYADWVTQDVTLAEDRRIYVRSSGYAKLVGRKLLLTYNAAVKALSGDPLTPEEQELLSQYTTFSGQPTTEEFQEWVNTWWVPRDAVWAGERSKLRKEPTPADVEDIDLETCIAPEQQAASARAAELVEAPAGDVPPLAAAYMKEQVLGVDVCHEKAFRAYVIYAQCVEGLPEEDPELQATEEDCAWFTQHGGTP